MAKKDPRRDFWCDVYSCCAFGGEPPEKCGAVADKALTEYDRRWTPCDECEGKGLVGYGDGWTLCGVCNETGYAPGEEKPEGGAT